MTVDIETLRACIAVVAKTGQRRPSEDVAYVWGWRHACEAIERKLRTRPVAGGQ